VRLLLDECVPRPLKRELTGHAVSTVVEQGWSSKRNSELLRLMLAEGFEAFLTVDQHLPFQQNVAASGVAVVVVLARTNRLKGAASAGPRNSRYAAACEAGRAHPCRRLTSA
jgi:hypothetical protein